MPNSVQQWDLSISNSQKVLLLKSKESFSCAVREPHVYCFEMQFSPPPSKFDCGSGAGTEMFAGLKDASSH
eukprot:13977286-Ditylum_brightwellii.AAC.1